MNLPIVKYDDERKNKTKDVAHIINAKALIGDFLVKRLQIGRKLLLVFLNYLTALRGVVHINHRHDGDYG